jgi:hypothetical protein
MTDTCQGRYGRPCSQPATVYWPALPGQWCDKHAPTDSGWMPEDDNTPTEGDTDATAR